MIRTVDKNRKGWGEIRQDNETKRREQTQRGSKKDKNETRNAKMTNEIHALKLIIRGHREPRAIWPLTRILLRRISGGAHAWEYFLTWPTRVLQKRVCTWRVDDQWSRRLWRRWRVASSLPWSLKSRPGAKGKVWSKYCTRHAEKWYSGLYYVGLHISLYISLYNIFIYILI